MFDLFGLQLALESFTKTCIEESPPVPLLINFLSKLIFIPELKELDLEKFEAWRLKFITPTTFREKEKNVLCDLKISNSTIVTPFVFDTQNNNHQYVLRNLHTGQISVEYRG
jgi:hypothetical protein